MKKLIILIYMMSTMVFAGEGADGGGPKAGINGLARGIQILSGELGSNDGRRISIQDFVEIVEGNNQVSISRPDEVLEIDSDQISDFTINDQVYDVSGAEDSYPELIEVRETKTYFKFHSKNRLQDIQLINGEIIKFK